MQGSLAGKVAIVTGGTSGIGQRVAERFAAEGAQVVVAARREAEGLRMATRPGIAFLRTDVSVEADVGALAAFVVERYGRIDCLVNNAALSAPMAGICDIAAEDIDRILAVNIRGVILGMKHVAPVMLRQGSGSIINLSSIAGLLGGYSAHQYGASKGAVIQLTRSVAAELGERNIRVNCISPGAIVTGIFGKSAGLDPSVADRITDVVAATLATKQPLPRAGLPDDIASAAVYLAGDGASFVNGQNLVVDGGMTTTMRHGWSEGLAARTELAARIAAQA